ncbi:hypothetical protein IF650_02560 [Cellulosimicrobium terreum]|nr:hypothetical protein [Cellulosimicrobium terreum]
MTTLAQLRKAALAPPETVETERGGTITFRVREVGFVSVTAGHVVQLHLAADDVDRLLAEHPGVSRLTRGESLLGARVPLADVNGQQLNHWVRRAWLHRSPKRLAASVAARDAAAPGQVGDLPASIGGPATRALAGAGLTSLSDVARLSDADLLALHGVGPKAVRILRAELAGR